MRRLPLQTLVSTQESCVSPSLARLATPGVVNVSLVEGLENVVDTTCALAPNSISMGRLWPRVHIRAPRAKGVELGHLRRLRRAYGAKIEAREIRTPNLLIWSQTHCRCAIPPLTDHRVQICARAAKTCVQTNLLLIPQPARPRLRRKRRSWV